MWGDRRARVMSPSRPAPRFEGDALTIEVECRMNRASTMGVSHAVTIHPDWSVDTPHDLDAERIATAFGGYTSCLDLVDRTIPAFRLMLGRLTRHDPLPVRRDKRGSWRVAPRQQFDACCRRVSFSSPAIAGQHLRSTDHLAREAAVPRWQLAQLLTATERRWGPWEGAPLGVERVEPLIREVGGAVELWRAGIRPEDVAAIAEIARPVREALPVEFFLGAVYANPDRTWLASVLAHRPDGETATWLAWLDSPEGGRKPERWAAWLDMGASKANTRFAVENGIDPQRVLMSAALARREIGVVARDMVEWSRRGCDPSADHYGMLARHGIETQYPSAAVLDMLVSDVGVLGFPEFDRTELAVMLAVAGTARGVLHAFRSGIRSARELDIEVRDRRA